MEAKNDLFDKKNSLLGFIFSAQLSAISIRLTAAYDVVLRIWTADTTVSQTATANVSTSVLVWMYLS